jgi:hypothetical protein
MTWLRLSFPLSTIELLDFSLGSTTSCLALKYLRDLRRPVDLLIVDHSLNDDMDMAILSSVTEDIIRQGLSRKIAMIYLSDRMADNITEVAYSRVTDAYQIPLLSYRLAVFDLLPNPYPTHDGFSPLWAAPLREVHPPAVSHYYVTMFISLYLTRLIKFSQTAKKSRRPILPPAKLFNLAATSSHSSPLYCINPYVDLVSGDVAESVLGFQPVNQLHPGWSYITDHRQTLRMDQWDLSIR